MIRNIKSSLDIVSVQLRKRSETLAVVESVTSGLLQSSLALAEGATEFYQGGITLYNLGQKARYLSIDPIVAASCNCVSEEIAQQMALGACTLFTSYWGIGITGYAAPVPEWGVEKKLFAYYSFAKAGNVTLTKRLEIKKSPMQTVQQFYVHSILRAFSDNIRKG